MRKSKKMRNVTNVTNVLLVLFLIGSISGNIVLASNYGSLKQNEKNLSKTVKAIEEDYKKFEDFNETNLQDVCDKYYEGKLRNLLGKDDLDYLAFMAWDYNIYVNGKEVKTPIVQTRSNNIEIKFTETRNVNNLPENIMKEGKFILNEEHLKDYFTTEFKRKPKVFTGEENGNRILTYTFDNIEAGDTITIRLGKALIERMMLLEKINLQDDKIEISKIK